LIEIIDLLKIPLNTISKFIVNKGFAGCQGTLGCDKKL